MSRGWRPRLVALDIDGTLLPDDGSDPRLSHRAISPAVRQAIRSTLGAGTQVVLSTGRPSFAVGAILTELGLAAGTTICSNGAVWIDSADHTVLRTDVFDLVEPVALLRELLPGSVFTAEEIGVGHRTTRLTAYLPTFGAVRVVDHDEFVATPTTGMSVHWPGYRHSDLVAALAGVTMPAVHCSVDVDRHAWMMLTPAGVTKGSALERLREALGVAESDTLAVGDGTNDGEMLRWAAWGVAMGQAPAVVRAAADEVCGPVGSDGLAELLGRWF
jgi:HAD superfamily hydrolase (TIGR01484 family)